MDDLKPNFIGVRELLVALPLVGTTLAITYDVGFFYGLDIEYFTLFSLAEHIMFALQALPLAFIAALIIPGTVIASFLTRRYLSLNVRSEVHARASLLLLSVSVLVLVVGIIGIVLKYYFSAIIIVFGFGGIAALLYPVTEFRTTVPFYASFFTVLFIVSSFCLGLQSAQSILCDRPATHTVSVAGSMDGLHGRLIRSGERGLLFFDLASKTVSFLIWAEIKRIQAVK